MSYVINASVATLRLNRGNDAPEWMATIIPECVATIPPEWVAIFTGNAEISITGGMRCPQ